MPVEFFLPRGHQSLDNRLKHPTLLEKGHRTGDQKKRAHAAVEMIDSRQSAGALHDFLLR